MKEKHAIFESLKEIRWISRWRQISYYLGPFPVIYVESSHGALTVDDKVRTVGYEYIRYAKV